MSQSESTRLNKYLALQLGISRREADEMITNGDVTIDGEKATLGAKYTEGSTITVRGKALARDHKQRRYAILHKPVGYVCSRRAQGDSPTIYSILPEDMRELKPVGRLDRDSSGIILLTNDGDFAHRMTHPSFQKVKVYLVTLDMPLTPLHQQMISDFGIMLDDGPSKFHISKTDTPTQYEITMSEGRNRQIRRTFAALGYHVTALHRTVFGSYTLGDISSGTHAFVDMR